MTATYSDGTPIQVGDIVRRGRGRVDYRVTDIRPWPGGDQGCIELEPLDGYMMASAIGAESIARLRLIEPAAVEVEPAAVDRCWTVRIPAKGLPEVVRINPSQPVWEEAAHLIGCQWVEWVAPLGLALLRCRLVVDESGRVYDKPVNPLASWLYGSHLSGGTIHGDAVVTIGIDTDDGPDQVWLTHAEADDLHARLARLTGAPS